MVNYYAQLNENNTCIGVSQLSGEVHADNMIAIENLDTDYLWRKYEGGQWSTDKYEPQSAAPLTEFEQTKQRVDLLEDAVNSLILGV
jgi:hypothetical protein